MIEKKISFWRIFWPTLIATASLSLIGWVIFILVIGSVFSEKEDTTSKAVLHLTLSGKISESSSSKINPATFSIDSKIGLSDILYGLESASKDDKVKGLYVEIGPIQCGFATAMEIRTSIREFRKSGKFVVAYLNGELITQKQYYISSAANEIYGFPTSTMEFLGLGAELTYFKGMFDKLDVELQVIRGSNNDFKSAVEPFFRTNMSDSSRLQITRYITSIWTDIKKDIAVDRKLSVDQLDDIAENAKIQRVDDAIQYKLIDASKYRDEVDAIVAKKAGLSIDEEKYAFEKYAKERFKIAQMSISDDGGSSIAVVVAEGSISVNGDEMTSRDICKYFREVRANKSIKAVVFRINSPGGSALASDEIWREVTLTAKTKKLIVSMGDVAASGGYYIASPASVIFAEPTTITGSIGVFGVIPYAGKLFENKLGLTFDRVQTNAHSVVSINKKLTEQEYALIQKEVDQIYAQFKSRVAVGRGMMDQQVERLARGRVWTGTDALTIGLVDKLGGLNDAIAYARNQIGDKKAIVRYWPKVKEDQLESLLEQISSNKEAMLSTKHTSVPKIANDLYEKLVLLESLSGIQMRLPYSMDIR